SDFMLPLIQPSINPSWTAQFTNKVYSTLQWADVKHWEVNQVFQLEGMGQVIHGPQADPRSWDWNDLFRTSPNMQHIPVGAPGLPNGTPQTCYYLSFIWYHYQLLLNPTNNARSNRPIDWGYAIGMLHSLASVDSQPQASVLNLWMVKGLQISQLEGG